MFLEKLAAAGDRSLAPPRYTVGEIVGMGGMGVVYELILTRGKTKTIDKVMKIVHPKLTYFAEAEVQLEYEANIEMQLADLDCVVTTLDYQKHAKGHGYKIMQMMQGVSLRAWLRQNPAKIQPLEISRHTQFKRLFMNLARNFENVDVKMRLLKMMPIFNLIQHAVKLIHERGVVHADLKPSNIVLTPDMKQIKIFDFGLARKLADQKRPFKTPFRAYTPLYASPEVLQGKLPNTEDDLYSLACIFWEMLFGKDSLRARSLPVKLKAFPEAELILKPLLCA